MNQEQELEFWKEYSQIYFNLEKAGPYRKLSKILMKFLNPKEDEIWLDVGCGPLRVSELIYKKSNGRVKKIESMDIILKPAREKLAKLSREGIILPVHLRKIDISKPLPYPDNLFDGVGANLVLPYVSNFENVLKELFRILKPGGQMVWSTPKYKDNFLWVFLASIPTMLNIWEYIVHKDFSRILQGIRILRYALEIQRKGKKGIYTFLPREELEKLLLKIGFINPVWEKTFSQQVWVNRIEKPK